MKNKMTLDIALERVKYCGEIPIVRKCQECSTYLDEQSEVIAKNRDDIEFMISHGYCDRCFKEAMDRMDAEEKRVRRSRDETRIIPTIK